MAAIARELLADRQGSKTDAARFQLLLQFRPMAIQQLEISAMQQGAHFHIPVAHFQFKRQLQTGARLDDHLKRIRAGVAQPKGVQGHQIMGPFQRARWSGRGPG